MFRDDLLLFSVLQLIPFCFFCSSYWFPRYLTRCINRELRYYVRQTNCNTCVKQDLSERYAELIRTINYPVIVDVLFAWTIYRRWSVKTSHILFWSQIKDSNKLKLDKFKRNKAFNSVQDFSFLNGNVPYHFDTDRFFLIVSF